MDEGTIALLRQRRNHAQSEFARKYCWIIPVCLWLLAFGLLWHFNTSGDFIIESDAQREYEVYSQIINTGTINIKSHELLNSALMTTALPAFLQRMTNITPLLLYQYYTLLIFPFLPVVLWFIFRRYIGDWQGTLASLIIIAQPHFLWSPSMARITMALLFVAIAILLILSKNRWKYPLIGITGALIVLSYYSTTFALVIGLAGMIVIWGLWSWKKRNWDFKYISPIIMLFCVVGIGSFIWHGVMFQRPMGYGKLVLSDVVSPPNSYPTVQEGTPQKGTSNFFSLESRDTVIQSAFGKTWKFMNIAQKSEFVVSWLIILLLSYGVLCITRRKDYRIEIKATVLIAYGLCVACVVYPVISQSYGIARTYYFASLALAPCLIIGIKEFTRKLRISGNWISSILVFSYLLATTGILHEILGLHR